MTLIELLIVLGLMAAVASVALTTLDGMGDRTRMDTTRNRLDMIETAIVGDGLSPGRFLSDMGRLPVIHATSDESTPKPEGGREFAELWDAFDAYAPEAMNDGERFFFNGFAHDGTTYKSWVPLWWSLSSAGLRDPDDFQKRFPATPTDLPTDEPDYAVMVEPTGGWRGPYLQVSGTGLYDGFGNQFAVNRLPVPVPLRSTVEDPDWFEVTSTTVHNHIDASITGVASWGRDAADDHDPAPPAWENRDEARVFSDGRAKATLIVSIRVRSTNRSAGGWLSPTTAAAPHEPIANRADGHEYQKDTIVRASTASAGTKDDDLFVCISSESGTAGTSAPTWSRTAKVTDGTAQWLYLASCEYMNRMRVVLFAPFADPNPKLVGAPTLRTREIAAWYSNDGGTITDGCEDSESGILDLPYRSGGSPTGPLAVGYAWSQIDSVTLDNVPPGIRQLYVYGYYLVDPAGAKHVTNAHASGLQTIELKPGVNHVTVYLSEELPAPAP
jgi:type II secretory pathway pseudopilin PulG